MGQGHKASNPKAHQTELVVGGLYRSMGQNSSDQVLGDEQGNGDCHELVLDSPPPETKTSFFANAHCTHGNDVPYSVFLAYCVFLSPPASWCTAVWHYKYAIWFSDKRLSPYVSVVNAQGQSESCH